jgi:hypothetical protein
MAGFQVVIYGRFWVITEVMWMKRQEIETGSRTPFLGHSNPRLRRRSSKVGSAFSNRREYYGGPRIPRGMNLLTGNAEIHRWQSI